MKREFSVGSEQWGAPRTRHYASVLFRSWQADPTPTAGTSTQPAPRGAGSWLSKTARHVPELPGTTPSDAPPGEGDDGDAGSGEAKGAAALADTNEYAPTFAPCFESGITGNRGADGAKYGSLCRGCRRCTQHPSHTQTTCRFRGEYCYLLQHRSPSTWGTVEGKGQNQLGLPGGHADPEDRFQPDVTAWREAAEELCGYGPLPVCCVHE